MQVKNYISEGIGSFLFIFFCCFTICFNTEQEILIYFTAAFIYLVLFYSFGNTAGCYFNPIISLSNLILKKIKIIDFFCYLLAELIGGFLGVFMLELILPSFNYDYGTFATSICCDGDLIVAMFIEIIAAYVMVLTFLGANSKSRNKNIRGFIIGAGIFIACILTKTTNFSFANPIKSFVTSITCHHWKSLPIFIISPFIGSILATCHFNWLSKKDENVQEENSKTSSLN